ncbi:MAG: LacI family DNA-binding transcriptional regulator [Alphaproteobacteria bacterium]
MVKRSVRLEDLAQLADVSIATVSRALNDSPAVSEATKRRVWKIARENNYVFRATAPALLSGMSATIALVLPVPQGRQARIADPFYLELIGGVGDAAREAGCDFIVSHVSPRDYEELEHLMASVRAEGVIFLGQSWLHDRFNRLAQSSSRFVVWGAALEEQTYCSVGSDNPKGGRRATAHLIRLGRRRIAFLGHTEAPETLQRYQGYLEALQEADIPYDEGLVSPAHFEVESAEVAVSGMLGRGMAFDGIVAASDLIAVGAVRALRQAGVGVPRDVSVVGYDDILLSRYSSPALSTIAQDMTKAGRLLVSKLMSGNDTRSLPSERLPTDLIVRESCGG